MSLLYSSSLNLKEFNRKNKNLAHSFTPRKKNKRQMDRQLGPVWQACFHEDY
jgi:hypothetical protein